MKISYLSQITCNQSSLIVTTYGIQRDDMEHYTNNLYLCYNTQHNCLSFQKAHITSSQVRNDTFSTINAKNKQIFNIISVIKFLATFHLHMAHNLPLSNIFNLRLGPKL